ncbi:MAG: type II secretion system protein, partial [Bacilli bacterium]|nr:type II secretion system protein [Bacilli bacterium]
MKKAFNKKKGFTIVELVIVVAVIGVLTAILVPTFVNLTNKANEASNQAFVKNLNTAMAMREAEEGKNKTMSEAVEDAK